MNALKTVSDTLPFSSRIAKREDEEAFEEERRREEEKRRRKKGRDRQPR